MRCLASPLLLRERPQAFYDIEAWAKPMNLPYVYQLLAAADGQRHGFIKLRGAEADHEVRLMAQAGLVEASFDDGREGPFTSINRVTASGEAFLRVFKHYATSVPAISPENLLTASQRQVAKKWKSHFALNLLPFRQNAPPFSEH